MIPGIRNNLRRNNLLRPMPAARRTTLVGALALLGIGVLALGGCEEDVKYGYVAVTVTIADSATPDYLNRVSACGVNVEGADTDFLTNIGCQVGRVNKNIGTFEWSTNTTGTVRFVVRLTDITNTEVGSGTSADVNIVPNNTVNANVVVTPTPASLMPRM
jgi:hypothetical protein